MIVYAWKQFWNDFNNGDEALFQDANRPRDNNRFKITPWMQAERWDWKKTNKNRDASLYTWYGFRKISNTTLLDTARYDFYRIRLKDKFTESDLSEFNWYQQRTKTRTAAEIRQYIEDAQATWNPKTRIIDWDIEILESGTYWIWCFAQFLRPNGHTRSSLSAMWVALLQYIDWNYKTIQYNMSRSCTDMDSLTLYHTDYLTQWTRIAPWACEWYWSNVMVVGGIYAMRIW